MVQVQHAFALARLARTRQRAAFTCLITWHAEVMGYLVAGAPDHRGARAELATVGRIGGEDAVLAVEQDVLLRTAAAYLDVVRSEAMLRYGIDYERALQSSLDASRRQFDLGAVRNSSVAEAQSEA